MKDKQSDMENKKAREQRAEGRGRRRNKERKEREKENYAMEVKQTTFAPGTKL